ncbi:MAG: hypothetical protein LBJ93_01285 [Clostridiales bacterium]|jgi:Na+/proline symporter|nr:hypothetical protein [Clostridiales bacterium]
MAENATDGFQLLGRFNKNELCMFVGAVAFAGCGFTIALQQFNAIHMLSIMQNNGLWAGMGIGLTMLVIFAILDGLERFGKKKEKEKKTDKGEPDSES